MCFKAMLTPAQRRHVDDSKGISLWLIVIHGQLNHWRPGEGRICQHQCLILTKLYSL